MATSKFGFGNLDTRVGARNLMPGRRYSAFGVSFIDTALIPDGNPLEFGEIFVLDSQVEKGYVGRSLATADGSQTLTIKLAVYHNDNVGTFQRFGRILRGLDNVTISAWLLVPENKAGIAVPFKDAIEGSDSYSGNGVTSPTAVTATSAVGGAVYVGTGGDGVTIPGVAYTQEISYTKSGGTKYATIPLTGYEFKTLPFKPTRTAAEAIVIGAK